MDMKERMIEYIIRNKVSTTEVADCLGKSGCLKGLQAVNRRKFCAGEIFYTYASGSSNWQIHEDVQHIPESSILFIDMFACEGRAAIGELVSKYVLLYRRAAAIVVNGAIRDAGNIIKEDYPVWCTGFDPEGCFNTSDFAAPPAGLLKQRRDLFHGAIAVCDDCGVVSIPKELHDQSFMEKLEAIEEQEDIWFDCIDRRKWTTFETVCLKKYLAEE